MLDVISIEKRYVIWLCNKNNICGIQIKDCLDDTGCEMIFPNQPTSKRSSSIIDFGITHDTHGWKAEILKKDHPITIQF